jgi:flagellar biosynthesis component FlhA
VGGVLIGVRRGLGVEDAISTFGVLTIGDGLVNILPALLVSVSAGIIVTHVTKLEDSSAHSQDLRSVIAAPQAVIMAALILFFLAVAPGFPFLPFVIIGVLSLSLLLVVSRFASRSDPQFLQLKDSGGGNLLISGTQILLEDSRASDSGSITSSNLRQNQQASLVELLIEIDQEFLSQYFMREDVQSAGQAFANQIRSSIFLSRGLSLPNLRFQTSSTLGDSVFSITIRNNSVYRGYLRLDEVWVCATRFTLDGFGIKITSFESNPINGLPGFWVAANSAQLKALNELGIDIYTPIKFVVLQAYGNALSSIDKLFGLVEVKELLRSSSNECQPLVEEIFDKGMLTVVEFSEVLRRLVREAIPINDIKLILEGIAEYATTAEPEIARAEWMSELHTCLRLKFAQAIIRSAISPGDHLRLFSVSVSVEEEFRESLSLWDKFRTVPPVDPEIGNKFCINAENIFRPVIERGLLPIAVVCSEDVRYAVQEYLNHYFHSRPWIKILSYEELRGQENVESVAVLN